MLMAAPLLAGRYRLQDNLSSTRMAEVWLAVDAELDRPIVVKLLAPGADRQRFEREARAVAGLAHPNIVRLFDFGEEARWYMVFEYLPAGSLEERLAEVDALSTEDVARIAGDVAAGLAHAHGKGVVHRDLKPANILFDPEGRSKIGDFGIAQVQGTDTLTDPGTVLGTAAYISPEQVGGDPTTAASDVYSFGVMLYRLLTGRLPFEAPTVTELAALHRDAAPPPISMSGDDRRRDALASLAMAALAKEPSRRPTDGAALLRALDGGTVVAAPTTEVLPAPKTAARARRRMPFVAGLAVVVLAGCGIAAALLLTAGPTSAPAVTGPAKPLRAGTIRSPSTPERTDARSSKAFTPRSTPTSTAGQATTAGLLSSPGPIVTSTPSPTSTEGTTEPATTASTTAAP